MAAPSALALAKLLDEGGCGWTLDVQQSNPAKIVQWLWAAPVAQLGKELAPHQVGLNLGSQIQNLGLTLVKPNHVTTHLPNQVEILEKCPFRPESCRGDHVVASGTGTLTVAAQ